MLSVIIPAYDEEGNIERTASAVRRILGENDIDYEIVFINDGSADKTWQKMQSLAKSDPLITAVNFSRNFGKESAIFAGLELARGDCAVLFDCDLQFPVETVVEMYRIWEKGGVDIVEGRKKSRGRENPVYKGFSLLFYKLIGKSSGLDMQDASDFKLMDRCVIDALNRMPERLTFFRAMSSWVGFRTEKVYFDVGERTSGKSKFSARVSIRYAIHSITSFSSDPMQLVTVAGVITFLIALIFGANTLYNKLTGNSAEGFSTVILLQLVTSAIIMFSLGIIGYYLAKIYEELKHRPRYIIKDKLNFDDKDKP